VYQVSNDGEVPEEAFVDGPPEDQDAVVLTDVSGTEARHARNSGKPPTRTMSLAEGRSFVSDLVTKWLGTLAGNA
jgi:hypothetical protein